MPSPDADRRWLLGVDGGGTKTMFVLADGDGNVGAMHRGGASYHVDIGVEGVTAVLRDGFAAVIREAGVDPSSIAHAFFGLPAYGEDPEADRRLAITARALLGHDRYSCENDMVCAWAGSLGREDGINVVAGTGSIAYGERAGRAARCGGWGEVFGDEGSAYWVAIHGLRLFTKMSDGRVPRGALYDIMTQRLGLLQDMDVLVRFLAPDCSRTDIAALAPMVIGAATAGDLSARAVVTQAAAELAILADAIAARLGFAEEEAVRVSYSGGMFAGDDGFATIFESALERTSRRYMVQPPKLPPHFGAVLAAARAVGLEFPKQAMLRLAAGDAR
jgi:N-acetylglucosamine kinase-like BadF-type ATPase